MSATPHTAKPGTAPAAGAGIAPAALSLRALSKRYGETEVLRGVDLDLAPGEVHALIGPNGAGKSTLFDIVSGRTRATSGRVLQEGEDITGRSPLELARRGLGRGFQITSVFPHMSVFENLRCAVLAAGSFRYSPWRSVARMRGVTEETARVLAAIGLEARRNALAGELSYAEQRALELGVTISGGARTLLLDEPTAGMSRAETVATVQLIRQLAAGRTIFIIEHDMNVVFDLAERVSVLVRGEIIASGAPEAVRADPEVRQAYLGSI